MRNQPGYETTGDAAQTFLALALRDAGRPDEALRVALTARSDSPAVLTRHRELATNRSFILTY
ncbi:MULTISPECIES: tetratricopeptide repeat protein [Micrococcales]|uniref:tetratricopeptide repeat protein n=1 Tax=Micrococcales TaxID=85006 RepID=UPI00210023F8|nr:MULTISPECIES: tetratricopeptide repeat protein [Micrococcales]